MSNEKFLSSRHEARTAEAREMRVAFANALCFLIRKRQRDKQSLQGIKWQAAKLAGFGEGSWDDAARYQTQRSMASRLMKDDFVISELERLGLKKDPVSGEWHDPKIQ